jgi:hypothetical protein
MTTQNAFAKVFNVKTDAELIKKHGLVNNSEKAINQILADLKLIFEKTKTDAPWAHKSMSEWGKQFASAWNLTKSLNPVTPLHYLLNYCAETGTEGFELMSEVAFMPSDIQYIFAKHFLRKK